MTQPASPDECLHCGHPWHASLCTKLSRSIPWTGCSCPASPKPTEPAQPRHTADHITNDDLDQLYTELEIAKAKVAELDRAGDVALSAVRLMQQTEQRAERAEAALNAVSGHLQYVLDYKGPGHAHEVPGRWDADGRPCDHCARLTAARAALDTNPS
ncbi:hypothetical protein [Streptomyces hydrogenans]|uniref:hypothetical protein n=1 Tax=Streptomyces hydrogenans TaxID=1873719 RepID=UPI0036EFCE57